MKELAFQNRRIITEENIHTLSPIQRIQLIISGELCFGIVYDDARDVLTETYHGNCELWDVVNAANHAEVLYDVWIFNVDTATVFYAGREEETGVGMIQYDFDTIENYTQEGRELAKALQKAYDQIPEREEDENLGSASEAYKKALKDAKKDTEEQES